MLLAIRFFCVAAAVGSLWLHGRYLFVSLIGASAVGGFFLRAYWQTNWEKHQATWERQQEQITQSDMQIQGLIKPFLKKKIYAKGEYTNSPMENLGKPQAYLLVFALAGAALYYSTGLIPKAADALSLLTDQPIRFAAILILRLIAVWLCMAAFAGLYTNKFAQQKGSAAQMSNEERAQ